MTSSVVDLSNCEREPIHVPERVQAHGVLVALEPESLRVLRVSDNVAGFFGTDTSTWLGRSVDEQLPDETVRALRRDLAQAHHQRHSPRLVWSGPIADAGRFDVVAHQHDGHLLLEIEPTTRSPTDSVEVLASTTDAIRDLASGRDLRTYCQLLVERLRSLLGYDRVMLYRFSEDWHGWVYAEARASSLAPFLDLHYPASDIPAQARALFLVNTTRLIGDVDAPPADLRPPVTRDHERLDQSYASSLRGVSPIHIEYLQNMKVKASLTIALVVGGRLWGLIACHHYAGRLVVPFAHRTSAELIARSAQLKISDLLSGEEAEARRRSNRFLQTITRHLAAHDDLVEGLNASRDALLSLVRASGFVAWLDGTQTMVAGSAPPEGVVATVVAHLNEHAGASVFATHDAPHELEACRPHIGTLAGVLAVPLPHRAGQWLLWFRPEERTTVSWAGSPDKPARLGPNGLRLTPRASFDAWVVETHGQSTRWSTVDVESGESLLVALSDVVYRERARLLRLTEALETRNRELDSFASMASHDLREPLRAIANYSTFIREDLEEGEDVGEHLASIQRLIRRMMVLIDGLLLFARIGERDMPLEDLDLDDAIRESWDNLSAGIEERGAELTIEAAPTLHSWRLGIVEVLQNLLGNAIRYSEGPPRVLVGTIPPEKQHADWDVAEGYEVIYVQDEGIGIEPRHHEAVFKVFRQVHTQGRDPSSSGLGLAMVRKIIERLGGRVWLASEHGRGTTIYFTVQATKDE